MIGSACFLAILYFQFFFNFLKIILRRCFHYRLVYFFQLIFRCFQSIRNPFQRLTFPYFLLLIQSGSAPSLVKPLPSTIISIIVSFFIPTFLTFFKMQLFVYIPVNTTFRTSALFFFKRSFSTPSLRTY